MKIRLAVASIVLLSVIAASPALARVKKARAQCVDRPQQFSWNFLLPGQPAPVAPGVRAVSQTVTANENQQTLRLQVMRVGDLTGDLNMFYFVGADGTANSPADFIFTAGAVQWAHNEGGVREVEVLLNGDTVAEPDETYFVDL